TVQKGDTLVVGTGDEAVTTRVKALLEPEPLTEMRGERNFQEIDEVSAAAGVKISAPDLDDVIAGSPVRSVSAGHVDEAVESVEDTMASFTIQTQDGGVVVRADSLASLEALTDVLHEQDIPVRKAAVGKVNKADVVEAENGETAERAILAFNTGITDAAEDALAGTDIEYVESDVIYRIVEEYEEWQAELERKQREAVLDEIARPAKIRIMPDHVFRQSDPAVVGVEIRDGVLNTGCTLMNGDGETLGRVKAIQDEGESIDQARNGEEVAVSITNVTVGRQVTEGEELYVDIPARDYKIIQRMEDMFGQNELQVLDEIVDIKDAIDPRWKIG
ncbi:MAG: translation initiation factor IF-2, partial [Candidatus Nanohaloarchaea archaeon]